MTLAVILLALMIVVVIDVAIRVAAASKVAKMPLQDECPPHQWGEVTIKNEAGDVLAWSLICKKCKFRGGGE